MKTYNILVADDDVVFLTAVEARLVAEGFHVFIAQDSYLVLEIAQKVSLDLLMLDVNMPAGGGFSVRERMKRIPKLDNIPVIYITGEQSDRVKQSVQSYGVSAVLYKPFKTNDLLSTINSTLGIKPELTSERAVRTGSSASDECNKPALIVQEETDGADA